MGPFKCPECGVWWAGFEHRCGTVIPDAGSYVLASRTGHCHGCSSMFCSEPDHVPCQLHQGGWTISGTAGIDWSWADERPEEH